MNLVPELGHFLRPYKYIHQRLESRDDLWRTRIAVIDDGIVLVENNTPTATADVHPKRNVSRQVKDGKSFVERKGEKDPWWHATDPHGTQMASLICAIDPCSDLYIAKVTESTSSGVNMNRVAKVRAPSRRLT